MSEERRYQDDEIQAIFGAAAEGPERSERAIPAGAGLTLPELREIGREVGIAPERITAAALALDERPAVARTRYLGMPIGVARTVDLPRAPTDREWAMLVAELRETFGARGSVESLGDLREWRNGNLHASVEPTETGYRLRLGTLKGSLFPTLALGGAAMGVGLMGSVYPLLTGPFTEAILGPVMLMGLGTATVGAGVLRLSSWARRRERQLDYIASRARALTSGGAADPG
jgi:hypothetical protein